MSESCVMKMHVFGCVELYSVFECLTGRFEAYRECVRIDCVVVLISVPWVSQCVPSSTSCDSLCVWVKTARLRKTCVLRLILVLIFISR